MNNQILKRRAYKQYHSNDNYFYCKQKNMFNQFKQWQNQNEIYNQDMAKRLQQWQLEYRHIEMSYNERKVNLNSKELTLYDYAFHHQNTQHTSSIYCWLTLDVSIILLWIFVVGIADIIEEGLSLPCALLLLGFQYSVTNNWLQTYKKQILNSQPYQSSFYVNHKMVSLNIKEQCNTWHDNTLITLIMSILPLSSTILYLFKHQWHRKQYIQWFNQHFNQKEQRQMEKSISIETKKVQSLIVNNKRIDLIPVELEKQYQTYITEFKVNINNLSHILNFVLEEDELNNLVLDLYKLDEVQLTTIIDTMVDLKNILCANPHIQFPTFIRQASIPMIEQLTIYKNMCNKIVLEILKNNYSQTTDYNNSLSNNTQQKQSMLEQKLAYIPMQ